MVAASTTWAPTSIDGLELPYIYGLFAELTSRRAIPTWLTGLILFSSFKTSVRTLVILTTRCRLNTRYKVALIKLDHAIAGIYMCVHARIQQGPHGMSANNNISWETVFTLGFEIDVLRGKRPYKWTIWVSPL
jgi:hypothetical protein